MDKNIDYSNINLGSVQIYESDIEKYGIENMILTEVLAQNIKNSDIADSVNEIIDKVGETVPALDLKGKTIEDLDSGTINSVVVSVVQSSGNPGKAVLDNVCKAHSACTVKNDHICCSVHSYIYYPLDINKGDIRYKQAAAYRTAEFASGRCSRTFAGTCNSVHCRDTSPYGC